MKQTCWRTTTGLHRPTQTCVVLVVFAVCLIGRIPNSLNTATAQGVVPGQVSATGTPDAAGTSPLPPSPTSVPTPTTGSIPPALPNTGNPSSGVTPTRPGDSPSNPLAGLPAQVIYLRNAEGNPVPVPADATLEKFLDWLQSSQRPENHQAPQAAISSVEMTGTLSDERAALTIRISVQIEQAEGFTRVPLALSELVLTDSEYEGPGRALFGGTDREQGLTWWFRGRGQHELILNGTVLLRRQPPQRRLSLSLPDAAVSHAELLVDSPQVIAKASEAVSTQVESVSEQQCRIDLFGMGRRLELSWQKSNSEPTVEAALEVNTTILARLSPGFVLLEATQRVQALQGTFDRYTVELPAGAELLRIEGREYKEHTLLAGTIPTVQVLLAAPTSGPATLRWAVRVPADQKPAQRLGGFVVPGARKQSGEIGLIPLEGHRVVMPDQVDNSLIRINAGELRPLAANAAVTRAYRFLSQPFELKYSLNVVEPYFTIEPEFHLLVGGEQLTLEARFRGEVFRGSLTQLTLDWPRWQSEGWAIESIEPRGQVVSELTGANDDPNELVLDLIGGQAARFEFVIRARRAVGGAADLPLSLMRCRASALSPAVVAVYDAENIASDLTAIDETVMRVLPASTKAILHIPETWADYRRKVFRIETAERSLSLHVERRPQQVLARTQASIDLRGSVPILSQQLSYQIEYERLSQIRLLVPRTLPLATVSVTDEAGQSLSLEPLGESTAATQIVRVLLPIPRLGKLQLTAKAPLVIAEDTLSGQGGPLTIPLLLDAERSFEQTEVGVTSPVWLEASLPAASWQPLATSDDQPQWRSKTPTAQDVPVQLQAVRQVGSAEGVLRKAWMLAVVDTSGRAQMTASLLISRSPSSLILVLPDGASLSDISVDGLTLPATSVTEITAGSRRLALRLPDGGDERLVALTYQLGVSNGLRWWNQFQLSPPELPQCLSTAQVLWHVVLPFDQHLWTHPPAASPLFQWQRRGLFWYRISEPTPKEASRWVFARNAEPAAAIESSGNIYAFGQIGAPRLLSVQTLGSPMVVLCGAGLSLIAGFLLLKVQWTRHPLGWLVVLLMLAVASLWYLPAMELLLQPMLIGVLLPIAALAIERWNRPRELSTVLTLGIPTPATHTGSSLNQTHDYHSQQQFGDGATQLRTPGSANLLPLEQSSGVS